MMAHDPGAPIERPGPSVLRLWLNSIRKVWLGSEVEHWRRSVIRRPVISGQNCGVNQNNVNIVAQILRRDAIRRAFRSWRESLLRLKIFRVPFQSASRRHTFVSTADFMCRGIKTCSRA
jgi:hypothetical protein